MSYVNPFITQRTLLLPSCIIFLGFKVFDVEIPWTEESDRLQSMGLQKSQIQLSN